MDDVKDEMKTCELCKKTVKASDGAMVLGGTAFECNECSGGKKDDHEHEKSDDGVCKFC